MQLNMFILLAYLDVLSVVMMKLLDIEIFHWHSLHVLTHLDMPFRVLLKHWIWGPIPQWRPPQSIHKFQFPWWWVTALISMRALLERTMGAEGYAVV